MTELLTKFQIEVTRNLHELTGKMADTTSKSDDESVASIQVNVKTPTGKETIEVAENATIKEVSYKLYNLFD